MYRILVLAAFAAFTLTGCSQAQDNSQGSGPTQASQDSQPEGYGNNPRLDNLYDDCAAGDATACENLYIESPYQSDYEAFAIEQGGADSLRGPAETTMQAPEPEQVSLGDTFESQGFEWTFEGVEVQQARMESTDYGDSEVKGPFVVLAGQRTNVTDEYISPDSFSIELYTDQTSYSMGSTLGFTVDYDQNLIEDDLAPGASKEGVLVIPMDSTDETPLYVQFLNPDTMEPEVQLNLEGEI
jgi:hypothetical protein